MVSQGRVHAVGSPVLCDQHRRRLPVPVHLQRAFALVPACLPCCLPHDLPLFCVAGQHVRRLIARCCLLAECRAHVFVVVTRCRYWSCQGWGFDGFGWCVRLLSRAKPPDAALSGEPFLTLCAASGVPRRRRTRTRRRARPGEPAGVSLCRAAGVMHPLVVAILASQMLRACFCVRCGRPRSGYYRGHCAYFRGCQCCSLFVTNVLRLIHQSMS
jgi:hypothetical protein